MVGGVGAKKIFDVIRSHLNIEIGGNKIFEPMQKNYFSQY